jgi:hypothetical protein
MVNRLMNMMFGAFIGRFLKDRIRRGSIQAVKGYLHAVRALRMGLMGLFGIGVVSAVLVSGIVLVIVGIIGLLPITTTAMSASILIIGLVLSVATSIGLIMAFNQKRWLKMSKSYELMDAVLTPWSGVLPPNPAEVIKREAADTPPPVPHAAAATTSKSTFKSTPKRADQESFREDYPSSHLAAQIPT